MQTCEIVGNVNILVFKTDEGNTFFKVDANNEDVLPILYIIEDTLLNY